MALINCPECDSVVSDKAFQCPKCAYPMNFDRKIPTKNENLIRSDQVTLNVQPSDINLNSLILLENRKSESIAILLTLIFGPLGLFYASSEKAFKLLFYNIIVGLIVLYLARGEGERAFNLVIFISIIFWVISMFQASEAVKIYNTELLENNARQTNPNKDDIDNLWLLIKQEKDRSFNDASKKDEIVNLLNSFCDEEERSIYLLNEYNERFCQNLITDLTELTTEKQIIRKYLNPFIEFNLVENEILNKL